MGSRSLPLLVLAGLALTCAPGCFYSRRAADVDQKPTVDTGMGAAVIMPGQSLPMPQPGAVSPGGTSQTRVGPGGETGSQSGGVVQPTTGNLSMIGGSGIDKQRHESGKEDPLVLKWLTAPFAALAAPFVYVAEKARGEPEPGPLVPHQEPPHPEAEPRRAPTDYETAALRRMEEELERREASTPAVPQPGPAPSAAGPSIADELAALQRAPSAPHASRASTPQPVEEQAERPAERPAVGEQALADGIVDRDEDGRIDLWIYREQGEIVRKALDQNFDGRPDTILHYDRVTHQLARVEEDADHDGVTDSWTDYRDGQLVRRRADGNGDGLVDTWSFYAAGVLARHEQDTTGDGYRDLVGFYADGHLSREERDTNGDGRTDVTTHYDSNERVTRREEDTDLDGSVDVVTHYENGRLARKELLRGAGTATP